MSKRYVILSDLQMPYHDKRAWNGVLNFIKEYRPDEVVNIGDVTDYPGPSRWNAGTKSEFMDTVWRDSAYTKKHYCEALREVHEGPSVLLGSNHGERPEMYIQSKAPAMYQAGKFSEAELLDLDEYEIDFIPDFYHFAPGWTMTHGHLGKIGLSQIAGNTALNAAKKLGRSVIMGHTHRAGIGSFTSGVQGAGVNTLTGMEVGNLMDRKQAGYLKGHAGNWQQAFGIVTVDGQHVQPQLVMISKSKFVVDGVTYTI